MVKKAGESEIMSVLKRFEIEAVKATRKEQNCESNVFTSLDSRRSSQEYKRRIKGIIWGFGGLQAT